VICENEIEDGKSREMLGLVFCPTCYENLVMRPDITPRTESGDAEGEIVPPEKPAVAQVRVDFVKPAQCHGCGRQIPAVGVKEFDGKPYCPDCYYNLPEIKAQKPKPFPATASGQQGKAEKEQAPPEGQESGLRCQACQRPVLPTNLKTVEGFEICLACLATDANTALDIARTRHRRILEKMKKAIDV
jgi:hypothetical protein